MIFGIDTATLYWSGFVIGAIFSGIDSGFNDKAHGGHFIAPFFSWLFVLMVIGDFIGRMIKAGESNEA